MDIYTGFQPARDGLIFQRVGIVQGVRRVSIEWIGEKQLSSKPLQEGGAHAEYFGSHAK